MNSWFASAFLSRAPALLPGPRRFKQSCTGPSVGGSTPQRRRPTPLSDGERGEGGGTSATPSPPLQSRGGAGGGARACPKRPTRAVGLSPSSPAPPTPPGPETPERPAGVDTAPTLRAGGGSRRRGPAAARARKERESRTSADLGATRVKGPSASGRPPQRVRRLTSTTRRRRRRL